MKNLLSIPMIIIILICCNFYSNSSNEYIIRNLTSEGYNLGLK